MNPDVERLLADRDEQIHAEPAELANPTAETRAISFGKRVGDRTSMAIDRLRCVQHS